MGKMLVDTSSQTKSTYTSTLERQVSLSALVDWSVLFTLPTARVPNEGSLTYHSREPATTRRASALLTLLQELEVVGRSIARAFPHSGDPPGGIAERRIVSWMTKQFKKKTTSLVRSDHDGHLGLEIKQRQPLEPLWELVQCKHRLNQGSRKMDRCLKCIALQDPGMPPPPPPPPLPPVNFDWAFPLDPTTDPNVAPPDAPGSSNNDDLPLMTTDMAMSIPATSASEQAQPASETALPDIASATFDAQ